MVGEKIENYEFNSYENEGAVDDVAVNKPHDQREDEVVKCEDGQLVDEWTEREKLDDAPLRQKQRTQHPSETRTGSSQSNDQSINQSVHERDGGADGPSSPSRRRRVPIGYTLPS